MLEHGGIGEVYKRPRPKSLCRVNLGMPCNTALGRATASLRRCERSVSSRLQKLQYFQSRRRAILDAEFRVDAGEMNLHRAGTDAA